MSNSEDSKKSVTLDEETFQQLMNRLNKLESMGTQTAPQDNGFDQYGKPTGVIQRYSIDPSYYKNPVPDLLALPELKRHGLSENYDLDWDVSQTVYETKYGTSMADPKFSLTLKRRIYGADGELTDRRILINTGIFFEDPVAAIQEATKLGLPLDKTNSPDFLSEMRFLRYKQWLMEIFNPSLPTSTKATRTDQVIDGKVYQIEDYSNVI